MIPLINADDMINFLTLSYRIFQILRNRRKRHAFLNFDQNFIHVLAMSRYFIMNYIQLINLICQYRKRQRRKLRWSKPEILIQLMRGYRSTLNNTDVWLKLESNWMQFFWLTGETPETLADLVAQIQTEFQPHFKLGNQRSLDFKNKVLICMIWLRQYPTMSALACQFGIPVSCVHKIIHTIIKYMHAYLVPKFIKWHTMMEWRRLQGFFPEWPQVVAILDCTPFRISKPKGVIQQIYYRGDRSCHFLNWLVIVDVLGFIVLSRPGFIGRAHDSTCLLDITLPVLPPGLQIMADQGFDHNHPVIVLPHANQPQLTKIMRRTFRSRRTMIERCFGILKNSFSSTACRFHSRKFCGPIICNLSASLYNRRRLMFMEMRKQTGNMYQ